jgi:hypothetical protein
MEIYSSSPIIERKKLKNDRLLLIVRPSAKIPKEKYITTDITD